MKDKNKRKYRIENKEQKLKKIIKEKRREI